MAKLKDHATSGVTLSMKNMFGVTPISIYGDDAGKDEPNEDPKTGRGEVCHEGKRGPAAERSAGDRPEVERHPGYRSPRITAELASARPIDISLIDGVETMAGGEGPWISEAALCKARCDAPRHESGLRGRRCHFGDGIRSEVAARKGAFRRCDNTLWLAEQLGVGTCDPARIEVVGVPVRTPSSSSARKADRGQGKDERAVPSSRRRRSITSRRSLSVAAFLPSAPLCSVSP